MSKTKGFTNSSKKYILIKISALFLGAFFLCTMSYAQIFTGKLLLIGNNYSTNIEENKNQDIDEFSISSMRTLILKSDLVNKKKSEPIKNVKELFIENDQKEDFELPLVKRLFKFVPILVVFTI